MGFRRGPSGFKPEKSALGVLCGGAAAALDPGTSAREEAAAAVVRKRRRVEKKFAGIVVFSIVQMTFICLTHGLSSGMNHKSWP
jgi:hypothetical protein